MERLALLPSVFPDLERKGFREQCQNRKHGMGALMARPSKQCSVLCSSTCPGGACGMLAFHCPNGGKRSGTEAAIKTGLGVVAGVVRARTQKPWRQALARAT